MKYPSMLQRIPSHGARPLRIGIWCDYGFTLTPKDGIGVFVYNLVAGLLSLDEAIEVVMLVRPGDQALVVPFQTIGPWGRLRVVPPTTAKSRWLRRVDGARRIGERITITVHRLVV